MAICTGGSVRCWWGGRTGARGLEAAAVLGGGDAEGADEGAAHGLGGAEAALRDDRLDGVGRLLEAPPGMLDADLLHVAGRGHADLLGEHAGEVPRAHAGARGQRVDRAVGARVVEDPALEVADLVAVGELGTELDAELRLVARAPEEQHEHAGDDQRHVAPQVVLDQRERQVHPRGDAGGGGDVAVAHEDGVGLHGDGGVARRERRAAGPVGGGPPPVEQAGFGEQERAAAHRRDAAGRPGEAPGLGDELGLLDGGVDAVAAGDHERVDRPTDLCERGVGRDREATRRAQWAGPGRRHGDGVAAVNPRGGVPAGAVEHLERAGEVEALDPLEDDDDHTPVGRRCGAARGGGASWHAPIMTVPGDGGNDEQPTIPAMPRDPSRAGAPTGASAIDWGA
jgi:hypothetical protein